MHGGWHAAQPQRMRCHVVREQQLQQHQRKEKNRGPEEMENCSFHY